MTSFLGRNRARKSGEAGITNLYKQVETLKTASRVGFIWKAIPFLIATIMLVFLSADQLGKDPMFALTLFVVAVLLFMLMYALYANDVLRESLVMMF